MAAGSPVTNAKAIDKYANATKASNDFYKWMKIASRKGVPKINDLEICAKYWIRGTCHTNCPKKATHLNAPPSNIQMEFKQWADAVTTEAGSTS